MKDICDSSEAGSVVYTLNSFLKQLQTTDDSGKLCVCDKLNSVLSRSQYLSISLEERVF